jgi:hypothetical protein
MEPDKVKDRKSHAPRQEFEVAYYTKELGRKLQRKMLQQQMESSGSGSRSAHGEDTTYDSHGNPPQHDRAG